MPDPQKQRAELERQVKAGGTIAEWAKRQLAKLFPPANAEPKSLATAPEPAPPPETPKEPAPVKKPGALGNCHDCGKPINKRSERQPFHRGEDREHVIYTCLICASGRWKQLHCSPCPNTRA